MNEIKYIPVTEAQDVCINYAKVAPASMMNLCVRVNILEELDESLFVQAVYDTVERLPYCRYRLHEMPDGTIRQYESTMAEQGQPCEVFDYSDYSEEKLTKTLSKWASEPFPNKTMDTALYRFRLIRRDAHTYCFFICGYHVIMDIYALAYTGTYIANVYDALKNGKELPPIGSDPENVVKQQIELAESDRMEKDKQWIYETFAKEPHFTSINGKGGKEFVKGKQYGHDRGITQLKTEEVQYQIPKELSDAILKDAQKRNITPYIYYVAALRTYLSRVNDTDDVEFVSLTADRSKLEERKSGLVRVISIAFRSVLGEDISFSDTLQQLNLLHRDYLRHKSIAAVRQVVEDYHHVPKGMHYFSIMFSYVSFVDFSHIPLKITASKIDSGLAITPLYILMIPTDSTGTLSVFYQMSKGYIKPESIDQFHHFMIKFLEAGLNCPEKAVKELVDESMD